MYTRIFLILSLISFTASAQQAANQHISIEISNPDRSFTNNPVKISYFNHYWTKGDYLTADHKYIGKIEASPVSIDWEQPEPTGYIRFLMLESADGMIGISFLAEQGDRIKLVVNKGEASFTGTGAEKYNCQLAINKVEDEFHGWNGPQDTSFYRVYSEKRDQYTNNCLKVLAQYRNRISRKSYELLRLNIIARSEYGKLDNIKGNITASDTAVRNAAWYALQHYQPSRELNNPETLPDNSSYLYDYLICKELTEIYSTADFSPQANTRDGRMFRSLYDNISTRYTGVIRDRLILTILTASVYFRTDTDSYLDAALKIVKDPFSRDLLTKRKRTLGKGAKAYDFALQDTSGNIVRLSDFRGKLVVLDFYFNGCTGCAFLTRNIKEVVQKFHNTPDLVFISIDVDKDMEKFREAVRSGKYTHQGGIQLYTNGQGEEHEIIDYYGIRGYPNLMIIDQQGNMLDSNPPRPGGGYGYTEQFITLLETALKPQH